MYFVSTIERFMKNPFDNKDKYATAHEVKTVGYYDTIEKARDCVINNSCDIWASSNDYAVIEKIPEGLYPDIESVEIYKFNEKIGKYEKVTINSNKNMIPIALIG